MYKGIAKGSEQNSKQAQQEENIGESTQTTIISSKTIEDVKESEKEAIQNEVREEKETNKKVINDIETSKVEKKVSRNGDCRFYCYFYNDAYDSICAGT